MVYGLAASLICESLRSFVVKRVLEEAVVWTLAVLHRTISVSFAVKLVVVFYLLLHQNCSSSRICSALGLHLLIEQLSRLGEIVAHEARFQFEVNLDLHPNMASTKPTPPSFSTIHEPNTGPHHQGYGITSRSSFSLMQAPGGGGGAGGVGGSIGYGSHGNGVGGGSGHPGGMAVQAPERTRVGKNTSRYRQLR